MAWESSIERFVLQGAKGHAADHFGAGLFAPQDFPRAPQNKSKARTFLAPAMARPGYLSIGLVKPASYYPGIIEDYRNFAKTFESGEITLPP